ncbi:MAG: right-handed parallel beta-helix repeat-containing protein, partial [Planctomycetota bacterium]
YAGGGMHNRNNSNPSVTNCTFMGNAAGGDFGGGGMLNYSSNATVTNCTFSDNTTTANGGGMCNRSCSPTVANCSFAGNSSVYAGGGMYNRSNSNPSVTNCTFTGNAAGGDYGGGGMLNYSSNPTVTNCTFTDNTTSAKGGGLYNLSCSPTVTNCILWGNTAATGPQIYGSAVVEYSDVEGGHSGTGNIDAAPIFLNMYDGNLRLGVRSPCVDAGNNADVPADANMDLDGNPRFVDDANVGDTGAGTAPIVDMGAYERQTDSAPGVNNAGTWYWTISEAMDEAVAGDVIEVGPETLSEGVDFNGLAITLRSTDPNDPNVVGVTIIDATGLGSSAVICADGEGPNTILAGFTIIGGHATNGGGMYCENSDPTVVNCRFSYNVADCNGGGMYCENSSPTVSNCNFSYNIADCNGGGMYCENSSPTVTGCVFYRNSTSDGQDYKYPQGESELHGRHGGHAGHGGGMYNDYSSPIVSSCEFIENRTGSGGNGENGDSEWCRNGGWGGDGGDAGWGAGMYNYLSGPTITNCLFRLNETGAGGTPGHAADAGDCLFDCTRPGNGGDGGNGGHGAGICNYDSSPIISYCEFSENKSGNGANGGYGGDIKDVLSCAYVQQGCGGRGGAGGDGAAMYNIVSSPAVTNCTFKANVGGDGGDGGVAGMGGCGLWPSPVTGGIAGDGGDGAAMYNIVSSPKVTGCKFEDNKSGDGGDGGDSMPCVCDIPCDYPRGSEGGDGGDGAGLYNSGSYPDVTNCSFTANWTGAGGAGGSGSPPGASGTRGAGAGIYDSNSSPTVTNCILWGDAPDEIVDDPCSTSVVNYSDVQGGYDGTGNIYAYPYFVHAAGGNLRLQSMSPCIDAGDNVSVPNDIGDLDNDSNTTEPLPWDLDGRARFGDGDCNGSDIVDMGAYEFSTADIGDFDDDCAVDFVDYAILSDYWLMDEPSVDIAPQPAGDGIIDERDLDILCENWLAGK